MKRILIGAAGAALLAVAMVGCGSSVEPSTPTPTATASAQDGGITLDELQKLYVAAGGQCDRITIRPESAVSEEAGDCEGGTLLTTYRSETQRDSAIYVLEGLQDSNPSPHVIAVGPDWIVNGDDAEEVAAIMNGETRQIGAD